MGKRMWQKIGSKSWVAMAVVGLVLSIDSGPLVTASEAEIDETQVMAEEVQDTKEAQETDETSTSQENLADSGLQEVIQTIKRTVPLVAAVEYIETAELPTGEERVVQVGQDGYRVEIYEQFVVGNTIQSEQLIEIEEEVPAQNELVEVGTAVTPEVKTQTRVARKRTPFKTTTQENANLSIGTENILQEGVDQIAEVTYDETYENGEVVNAVEVSRTVVQEGKDEIVEVGTQKEPELPNDAAVLQKIDKEPVAVKYEKATQGTIDEPNSDGSHTILEPSPHSDLVSNPYNFTPEMIEYHNKNMNVSVLNQEFGKLLNEARTAQGKQPVSYMPDYQTGVDTRANELADVGNIRVNNQPHVRLDGRSFDTAFDYLGENKGGVGENLAGMNYDGNPYELVSEKYLAKEAYKLWLDSPGHKTNQEDTMYNGFAVSVAPVAGVGWNDGAYDSGYIAALGLVAR